jgi:hypothetical protein
LTWLDDHSRYALSVTAWNRVTGPIVVATFRAAVAGHGAPASTLTDNGMVFTTRLSGGEGGRNAFEHELRHLGITQGAARLRLTGDWGLSEDLAQLAFVRVWRGWGIIRDQQSAPGVPAQHRRQPRAPEPAPKAAGAPGLVRHR